ncbi:MAG: hypothetical protein KGJ13_07170 [Patescibacteria group bacterium]|nr:hypothetical protein [Patescibacteria group bacterium]
MTVEKAPAVVSWKGVPIADLPRDEIEAAFRKVCAELWARYDETERLQAAVRNLQKYG